MGDDVPAIKLGAGIFSVEFIGKHSTKILIFLVITLVGVGIIYEDNMRAAYKRWTKSAYFIQYDNLASQHKLVREVTDQWDNIKDIDDHEKDNVEQVRENLFDALSRYEKLETDKLDASMQVVWLWHLAKLKIIEADITGSYNAITKAIAYLDKAEVKSTDPAKLTPKDIDFLNQKKYNKRIRRTRLNAYALAYFIKGLSEDKQVIAALLKVEGGCKKLKDASLNHIKIISALGCARY